VPLSSVRSAVRLIGLFTDDAQVLGVSEIARRLNVAKSTASRLTTTLSAEDILSPTANGKYRLSIRLVSVGLVAAQSHAVYEPGREALTRVHAATGLAAHLSIIDGAELAQLCRVTSDYMEQVGRSRPRQPVLATSAGRAILAYSAPSLIEQCMQVQLRHRYAPPKVPGMDEVLNVLRSVRQLGYAISRDDYVANVVGVAVPILTDKGTAVAALTALGPSATFPDERVGQTASVLMSAAKSITNSLYH
jgi:IclR family transcriptional regulator, KDG regulon repressor